MNYIKKKLRYQTWEYQYFDRTEIVHHSTPVVTFHKDGTIEVTTGGWYSSTTKERINDALRKHGYNFFIEKGDWFVKDHSDTYEFTDGMKFKNGQLVGGE
jgi:hypothetical protein